MNNNAFIAQYTGEAFGYSPEENRIALLNDISKQLNSENNNNAKIIFKEIKEYGGKHISFYNGCKDAILIGAFTSNEDYYYMYYNNIKHCIGMNTGCDGIDTIINNDSLILDSIKIDKDINDYIENHKFTEIPFTEIYTSDKWCFKYININKIIEI